MQTSAFSASQKKIELVKQKITSITESKKQYQQEMNEADGNKMMLAGEIQKANEKKAKEENKLVKIDTDLENLQTRVWEEYQMTYADAKQIAVAEFDNKAGTEECAEIKRKIQRLGNVNLAAIEKITLQKFDEANETLMNTMDEQLDELEPVNLDEEQTEKVEMSEEEMLRAIMGESAVEAPVKNDFDFDFSDLGETKIKALSDEDN